jgi:PAS domain-containing protein
MQSDRLTSCTRADGGDLHHLSVDYRAVFEALATPSLVLAPPDFVMLAANEARLRVTNTRREDAIGRKRFDVFPDNPDDPEATGVTNLRASLARVLATRRTDVMRLVEQVADHRVLEHACIHFAHDVEAMRLKRRHGRLDEGDRLRAERLRHGLFSFFGRRAADGPLGPSAALLTPCRRKNIDRDQSRAGASKGVP